jgi:hypothetical protein
MLNPDKTLLLAAHVAVEAEKLGIKTALIGAAALAVHGYARGTQDIDLAAVVLPLGPLSQLAQRLQAEGLYTELRLPDEDDPLGGVLVIAESEAGFDVVEVVNFLNPLRRVANPAAQAIARAFPLDGVGLHCVALADLVALKLYAGGMSDHADIVQLLARNSGVDLNELRAIAGAFDSQQRLDELIEQAQRIR